MDTIESAYTAGKTVETWTKCPFEPNSELAASFLAGRQYKISALKTLAAKCKLVTRQPWGVIVAGTALCGDGVVRKLKRVAMTADTFFSVPASVTVKGKTVAGYVTSETFDGSSVCSNDDPAILKFRTYTYRKNHALIIDKASTL